MKTLPTVFSRYLYGADEGLLDPDEVSTLRMIERVQPDYSTYSPAWPIHTLQGCPMWLFIVLRRLQARRLISGSRRGGWRLTARGERLLAGCRREGGR